MANKQIVLDLIETTQVALVTGNTIQPCPHCRAIIRAGWEIPRNGIGVVCEACGAWCLVREEA